MCLEIYEVDSSEFFSASELALQSALKKSKVKLDFLTDIHMLLIVEESTKGGMCHTIYRYVKANKKYMKEYNKNK